MVVDIGTTNVKAGVFKQRSLRPETVHSKPISRSSFGEQDLREIANAVTDVMKGAVKSCLNRVDAVFFTSQMHGLAVISRKGEPISPLYTYLDTRSIASSERLEREHGLDIYKETGCPPLFIYPLVKILWLKEARAVKTGNVRFLVSAKDYVLLRLTGEHVTDISTASGSQMVNIKTRQWSRMALDIAGIDETMLPALLEGEREEIYIRKDAADDIGLSPEVPVYPGISDAAGHNFGVGVFGSDSLALNIGTSAAVRVASEHVVLDVPKMRIFNYYAGLGRWIIGGAVNNGGILIEWYRRNFAQPEEATARYLGVDVFSLIERGASLSPPFPKGLLIIPYLSGERFPVRDPRIRGVIYGVTLETTTYDVARALMEGLAFTLRWIYDALRENGIDPKEVRASGGGATSELWRQIIADVFNLPVVYVGTKDATLRGAALVYLIANGYVDLKDLLERSEKGGWKVNIPKHSNYLIYKRAYQLFKELYYLMRDFSHKYHESDDCLIQ